MPKGYKPEEPIKLDKLDILSEMSYNILPSQLGINPYNPDDLIMKKSLYIYDQIKDDECVKVALLLKKTLMLANNISVEPASSDRYDIEIKDFVEYNLFNRLKTPFKRVLESVLSAMDYGYSVSEMLLSYIEESQDFKGKIGLSNIKTRPPHGFDFKTDALGDIISLRQFQGQGQYSQDLPASKFLIHTYNKQFDNHYGNADLRAIYRPWWCKDVTLKFYAIHLERYGTPLLIGYYTGTLSKDESDDLKSILTYILKGTSFKLPDGKIRIDKIDFNAPQGYEQALDRFDKMITRGLLMPDQLGFTNTTSGTYNLGLSQFDMFYMVLQKFMEDAMQDVDSQVIKPLVNMNYKTDKYPKLKLTGLNNDELDKLAGVYTQLTTAGYMSPQNKADFDFVREKYELPKSETLSEDKNKTLFFSAKNQKTLSDMIKAENNISEKITKGLPELSEDEYEKLIKAFEEKDFDAMQTIIENNGVKDLQDDIEDILMKRYELGYKSKK
jgi:phage gp29-like protein